MSDRIKQWIGFFFDGLPYSEEAVNAREKIEEAMLEQAADSSPEELAERYGSCEKLAELGGYDAEQVKAWRSTEALQDGDDVKKRFRAQRWRTYLFAALCAAVLSELIWTVYNAVAGRTEFFFTLLLGAAIAMGAFFVLKKIRHEESLYTDRRYDTGTYVLLRDRSDKYAKRLLNSIALLFAAFALFFGSEFCFYVLGSSKPAELVENVFANMLLLQIPLFLVIKNAVLVHVLQKHIGLPDRVSFFRHTKWITVFSLGYWIAVIAGVLLLRDSIYYPANIFITAGVIFFLLILAYNLTLRKRITYKNIVFNKRRFAVVTAICVLTGAFTAMRRETYYTQPFINSLPVVEHSDDHIEYDEQTGIYTITSAGDDFKILHLTDIHLGGSLSSYRQDVKALAACYELIENTHPDLVIVTGDLSFPMGIMSMSFNNSAPVRQFASFMRNLGIPWAFTYGNHDTESMASLNKEQLDDVYKSLSFKTSGTLLYPYVQPEIMGRNNQLIEVRNSDGSLNTGLFLIDSNTYTGEGINVYDYIHDDQVDWYASNVERMNAEAGETVPSMLFFHIPLQQYRTAYELYETGSDEVMYFFGENGEKMIDKVCCSDYPSSIFDRAIELGSTEAMFCGHDHYNNMSLEYQGIRLTYGMSIDYLVMPGIENDTEQRGGELITIHSDGSWDLWQIPLTSITD